jgi:polygalacturonase
MGSGCFPNLFAQTQVNVPLPKFKKDTLSIVQFGAVSDGFTLNTTAINRAIDQLSNKGGGVVAIPPGLWLTGPIELKSNINLYLSPSATLLFSADFNQYRLQKVSWEGVDQMRNQAPIYAIGATNIAITGKGVIDGNGDAWRMVKKEKLTETQWKKKVNSGGLLSDDKKTWYPTASSLLGSTVQNPGVVTDQKDASFYQSVKDFLRPNLVVLEKCSTVLLEGVTFQNSPAWCLHPLMSRNITVKNVLVKNPWYAQNGDGIDVESCDGVLIENSIFDVGDDALCMKSGRDEAGRKRNMPTQNVTIRNCLVYAAHGGFVIGSEMSGGVKNISVSKCTFIGTDIGLRFKSARGRGGVVENIHISDIYMKDIVGEAILFDMYYMAKDPIPTAGEQRELPAIEAKPFNETTPIFKNFTIQNVQCAGAETAVFIRGLPEAPIQQITFSNMNFQSNKGIEIQEASQCSFSNVRVSAKNTNPLIQILQGSLLKFDKIQFNKGAQLLCLVTGDRSNQIIFTNTLYQSAEKSFSTISGASPQSILFK